jgi:hypothetical protein
LFAPEIGEDTMRTTKRFTPTVLARFARDGRGTGIYEDYIPWHRVSRGDPASSGRSHLVQWQQRFRELLSDGELFAQYFALMVPDLDDCTEQFPLTLARSRHPLTAYGDYPDEAYYPGTIELAVRMGIRHPKVRAKADTADWTPTTDHLLVIKQANRCRTALAVAYKPAGLEAMRMRTRQLLELEYEYWACRGIPWLLITPAQYDRRVALTLSRSAPWAIDMKMPREHLELAACTATELAGYSLTRVIEHLGTVLGDLDFAQRALWQAVWRGILPIDLRRGWRPHAPLKFLSPIDFQGLNPIISRRSAWI